MTPDQVLSARSDHFEGTLGRLPPRRLISIAHSYAVGMNRRLAYEMANVGGGSWEVTAVALNIFTATI